MSHLTSNLHAMRPSFAELVALLENMRIPAGFSPAQGSDGTSTFARMSTDGSGKKTVEWLGSTSMPAASAEAITSTLDASSGGANGLGLSIGTGFEWCAFLQRLGKAQAIFVYEPDPALIRMALEICDLSQPLAAGRLVLLTGAPETAAEDLVRFLQAHPGYEPPSVLHPLPTAGGGVPERRNQLLAAGELIVRRAVQDRQSQTAVLLHAIEQAAVAPPQKTATAAFLLTPRFPNEFPIALQAQREGATILHIDRHDQTSLALRLQTLVQNFQKGSTPLILSALFRAQLGPIPAQCAVHTWVPPMVGAGFWNRVPAAATFSPQDRVIVHHAHHAAEMTAKKIPAAQVELRPLIRELAMMEPVVQASHSHIKNVGGQKSKIALIADLPRFDADSLAITLPTHVAVYHAACELIAEDYLTIQPASAPNLLRRALMRLNLDPDTKDPALAEQMLRIIRDVLIPCIPPVTLAKHLRDMALATVLIGDWPTGAQGPRSSVVPFNAENAWEDVALLAHLSPQGVVSPLVWNAIDRQIPIAAPEHSSDALAGSLPQLTTSLHRVRPREFLQYLKSRVG